MYPKQKDSNWNTKPSGHQNLGFSAGNQRMDGPTSGGSNQPVIRSEVQKLFNQVDKNHSGRIDYTELQAALKTNHNKNFSEIACKLLISMFDSTNSGTVDVYGFQELFDFINLWMQIFHLFDRDRSGSIEEMELTQALQQLEFNFSPELIRFLIFKFDFENHSRIDIDQFIVLCIQVQRLAYIFMKHDTENSGIISIGYEDFLIAGLQCSP